MQRAFNPEVDVDKLTHPGTIMEEESKVLKITEFGTESLKNMQKKAMKDY